MQVPHLRSGTDSSDPGNIRRIADRAAIERHVPAADGVFALGREAGVLVSAAYPAFEGNIANGPHLRLGLCVGRGAKLVQDMEGTRIEGIWQPGCVAITPPDRRGEVASAAISMVGLAILPDACPLAPAIDADHLDRLSRGFQRDVLLATVMTALLTEAGVHGSGDAFVEHGVALVLRRLSELSGTPAAARKVWPLSSQRHARLTAWVDAHIDQNLSVSDMAATVGMEPSGFTRALRARTGLPPFAWLTQHRMERAADLLASGRTVAQVAARVGYANPGKFAAAFRRFQGRSPSHRLDSRHFRPDVQDQRSSQRRR